MNTTKLQEALNNMETSNPPDSDLKTLFVRMLDDLSENFKKKRGNIKMEIGNKRRTSQK